MDEKLKDRILSKCNSHIVYEDRRAGFSEIAAYCKKVSMSYFLMLVKVFLVLVPLSTP